MLVIKKQIKSSFFISILFINYLPIFLFFKGLYSLSVEEDELKYLTRPLPALFPPSEFVFSFRGSVTIFLRPPISKSLNDYCL